MPIILCPHAPR